MTPEKAPAMPTRRLLLTLAPALAATACGGREPPAPLPPLITGYRHLTPIRLNVVEVEVQEPAPGAVRVTEPAPVRPEVEMRRMAEERLIPMGSQGRARFLISAAQFVRDGPQPTSSRGTERLSCRLLCRLEILGAEGAPVAFVEAEARRNRTVPDGTSVPARLRAAEEVVRGAMDDLNVEFEFQIRRTLRAWLVEGPATPPAATAPEGGPAIQREDLPRT